MTTIKTTAKRFNSARQWEIATRLTVRSGNRTDGDASRLKRLRVQVAFHPPDAHRMCRRGCDHSHLICRRFRTWTSRVTYKPACRVARSWSLTVLLFCDTDSFPIVCVCSTRIYPIYLFINHHSIPLCDRDIADERHTLVEMFVSAATDESWYSYEINKRRQF